MKTKVPLKRGTCRYCRCTERSACRLEEGSCAWLDLKRTICNNPACARSAVDDGLAIRMRFGGRGGSVIVARA